MTSNEVAAPSSPLPEDKQPQQIITSAAPNADNTRQLPNLPRRFLLTGLRDDYLRFCLPLYEASIKCDWKAAKAILDQKKELVRYSITENGETALHVAASAKGPKHVEEFVQNLVDMMTPKDLALENKNFETAFYLAAVAGNLESIKIMVENNNGLLGIPGGAGQQMLPLYAAAVSGKKDVVKHLYGISKLGDDDWTHQSRGLLLEKCVDNSMFDVALQIVKKYPELGRGSVLGILAQKPRAFAEKKSLVFAFIGSKAQEGEALQLLRFILDDIMKLPKNEIDRILRGPNASKQTNKPVFGKVDQALELQKLISEHIVNMHVETQNILEHDSKSTFTKADQLEKVISEHTTNMQAKSQDIIRGHDAKETHSSYEALFIAAEMGNTKFLVELIRRYPDLMWKVNDSNQTIFHIAVENRHEAIYNMLYEIGYMKDSITSLVDENGNNMLHLVAKIAKKKKLEKVPGVIFQMQRELLWFEEVKYMINPSCRGRKNKDGLTAQELFTKEHEDLLAQSVKWVKGTANQCMVVAALVATITFAAAITIPGGYNQESGIPIFYRDTTYTIFILADAVSLFASSTSTVLFINILTSRFTERDFLESIPKYFMLFLSTLFLSITAMIVSFSISFFLIYRKEMQWLPNLISVFAILPVLLYFTLQQRLLMDVFRSTYGSRYLFKPKKHVLYYQNPVL